MNEGVFDGINRPERILGVQTFSPTPRFTATVVSAYATFAVAPEGAVFARVTGMSGGGIRSTLSPSGGYNGWGGAGATCLRVPLPIEVRSPFFSFPPELRGLFVSCAQDRAIRVGARTNIMYAGGSVYAGIVRPGTAGPQSLYLELTPGASGSYVDDNYGIGGSGGSATIYSSAPAVNTALVQAAGGVGGNGVAGPPGRVVPYFGGLLIGGGAGSADEAGNAGASPYRSAPILTTYPKQGTDAFCHYLETSTTLCGALPTTPFPMDLNYNAYYTPPFVTIEWIG